MDLHDTDLFVKRGLPHRLRAEGGQVAVETMGLFGLIGIIAFVLWQIALIGYTYVLAGHAAREGARALAVADEVRPAVREDLPQPWKGGLKLKEGEHEVKVRLSVPIVIPGVDSPLGISSTAGTSVEDEPVPPSQQPEPTTTDDDQGKQ